jgi:hypothetical protein
MGRNLAHRGRPSSPRCWWEWCTTPREEPARLAPGGAAVRRLSSEVHIVARAGGGSEILCRVSQTRDKHPQRASRASISNATPAMRMTVSEGE